MNTTVLILILAALTVDSAISLIKSKKQRKLKSLKTQLFEAREAKLSQTYQESLDSENRYLIKNLSIQIKELEY